MIEFRTLGQTELVQPDGTPLLSLASRSKALGLLAYLTLTEGSGPRRREDVCALLWPDSDQSRARNSLNQTLHILRSYLGSDAITGGREAVGIGPGFLRCDAVEFRSAISAEEYDSALKLYRGELLPGFHLSGSPDFERWLDQERRDLRTKAFAAARRVASEIAADDRSMIRALRHARRIRPDDDETVRDLIEACRRQGNDAAALREYEVYRAWLDDNFGLVPPEETRRMVAEIRAVNGSAVAPGSRKTDESARPSDLPATATSTPGVSDSTELSDPSDPAGWRSSRRFPGMAGIVAGACVIVLASFLLPRSNDSPDVRRLAVLPLADFSPDGDREYFTNSLTDELITALGHLGEPEVVGFRSVQMFRESPASIEEVARQLNVDAVIEGSATWDGQQVRVNLQLVAANPERHIWAHVWEGRASSFVDFQRQIAVDVARRFGAPAERVRAVRRSAGAYHDIDPSALAAYYRGRALWKRYRQPESIEAFLEAVSVEPDWALPWAGLADAYVLLAHAAMPPSEAMLRAQRHIDRAVELDPDLERTQVTLGHYLMEGPIDWEGAERAFRRAEQLNPGYPDTYVYSGQLYMAMGRYDEARDAMERAFSLDPQNPVAYTDIGKIYLVEGRHDAAIDHFRKAVETYPEHPITRGQLIYALLEAGEWGEAIDLTRQAISDGRGLSLSLGGRNPSIAGWLAYALARNGETNEARTIADSLADLATREYLLPLGIAAAYAGLGDRDVALDWLERMEEDESTQRAWLLTYSAFEELHGSPRFEAIVSRLGLQRGVGMESRLASTATNGEPDG